jgi:hypothetical protein
VGFATARSPLKRAASDCGDSPEAQKRRSLREQSWAAAAWLFVVLLPAVVVWCGEPRAMPVYVFGLILMWGWRMTDPRRKRYL